MCIMRNLSYHVHKEVPGADKYQELDAGQTAGTGGSQKKKKDDAGCFGGKKAKGMPHREPKTGNVLGVNCAVWFCSCKPFRPARVMRFAEVRVCSAVARGHLPCCVTARCLGPLSTIATFCLALSRSDACCCKMLLLDNGGCALPILFSAVFLHLSDLCLVCLLGCRACADVFGSQASTRPSPRMGVLSVFHAFSLPHVKTN